MAMLSETRTQPIIKDTSETLPMIYIVGNSFCGSTLLGFLLSSNPDIVFLGELKIKTWLGERSCSCGQPINSCTFYSDYFTTLNDIKKSVFEDVKPSVYAFHVWLPGCKKPIVISSEKVGVTVEN